jgi:hypothetical protein
VLSAMDAYWWDTTPTATGNPVPTYCAIDNTTCHDGDTVSVSLPDSNSTDTAARCSAPYEFSAEFSTLYTANVSSIAMEWTVGNPNITDTVTLYLIEILRSVEGYYAGSLAVSSIVTGTLRTYIHSTVES